MRDKIRLISTAGTGYEYYTTKNKRTMPEKMKIKLVIVNHALSQPHRFELRYFITEGHLDRWVYSTPECPKRIETDFAVAACNPG